MKIRRSLAIGVGLGLVAPLVAPGLASGALPETDTATRARTWLVTQQQADGGFEVAQFPGFETSDAIMALGSVGEGRWDRDAAITAVRDVENSGGLNALDAIDDLIDNEADPTSVAAWARAGKVTALVAQPLGIDATSFDPSNDSDPDVDLIARINSRKNPDGSFDFGAQFNGALYAAIAIARSGELVPQGLKDQILAGQRSDGSWDYTGTTTGGGEDIDTTSLALLALAMDGDTYRSVAVENALKFLADRQQASGAWQAFGSDDPNATSMATLAISALRLDPTTSAWRSAVGASATGTFGSPVAWLMSQQSTDGHIASGGDSWGINTFATTQSMQAIGQQWWIENVYGSLLESWSQGLASPADDYHSGWATDANGVLGPNSAIYSRRLSAASAVVNGQRGREAAVADLFDAAFDRQVDPSGRAYWSARLITLSRPEVLARLTGSSEFFRQANSDIPTFVDDVYGAVLGRSADPSGRAFWIAQLQAGRSVQSVARYITASGEYRRLQVTRSFQRILDRGPSAVERDQGAQRLVNTRVEVILAELAASQELYDQFPTGVIASS